jgi:galactosamine-6-phosphate isomerase
MKKRLEFSTLQVEVSADYDAMSRRAEELIVRELRARPNLILCASAGGTPTGLYARLALRARRQPGLFRKLRVLQVDEWGGLEKNHPASCEADVRTKLLEPLQISADRYFGFRTEARNAEKECARMRDWLAAHGPIDICILGLGLNGHVAMNEPGPELSPHAHIAKLTPSSLKHPMLTGLKAKPRYGLTLGMRDILASRLVLLLVNGTHKQAALERLLQPEVTTRYPASFIWLHPRAYLLCDRQAAARLPNNRAQKK